MINAKLVTCGLCQHYYSDPRQIPCSHSFCFDCISGRFDETALTLICPLCHKTHQYQSLDDFQRRCMRDGFLASIVTQFKRNQSRANSRPTSTISHLSSSSPIPPPNGTQETKSERLTPLQRPASVLPPTSSARGLVAKCQSCNIRGELIVCQHCDNVICEKCANEHQSVISKDVKTEWQTCKTKFETIQQQSMRFDQDQEEMNKRARDLQGSIQKHGEHLTQTVENRKNACIDIIEKHRQVYRQSYAQEQVIDEYESIDKRLGELFKSPNINSDKINDFLFEIEHLDGRLDHLNKLLDTNQLKFPQLTLPEQVDISSLFGLLQFLDLNSSSSSPSHTKSDPYSSLKLNGYSDTQSKHEDEDHVLVDSASSSEQKKKLLWQIDYFSVPYYVRTYHNQLFVCDRYGSLAIYRLNGQQKPTVIREVKLFKDALPSFSSSDDEQTIIDSFTIYKFWIIVFKRKKNELNGTIYLFTHEGKAISNGKFLHHPPSRELTVDTDTDRLWSLDQKQLGLFYYDLPDLKVGEPEEYFQTRHSHVLFSKPFAPIHISVNKSAIAVLDKNRQAIHVYEKKTRQQLYEYVNMFYHSTHFCWDMALFSNNNLLIKLDDMSTLKVGPSKHIYLQLDTKRQNQVVGLIEEIDAYGMMITANDEILIGVRINTKGILKCYV